MQATKQAMINFSQACYLLKTFANIPRFVAPDLDSDCERVWYSDGF